MNLDDKIRQELLEEAQTLDSMLHDDMGLFARLLATLKGPMRYWMLTVVTAATLLSVGLFWSGYRFFTAHDLQSTVFWGICMLALLIMQAVTKLWIFIEANRQSTLTEIKQARLDCKK